MKKANIFLFDCKMNHPILGSPIFESEAFTNPQTHNWGTKMLSFCFKRVTFNFTVSLFVIKQYINICYFSLILIKISQQWDHMCMPDFTDWTQAFWNCCQEWLIHPLVLLKHYLAFRNLCPSQNRTNWLTLDRSGKTYFVFVSAVNIT